MVWPWHCTWLLGTSHAGTNDQVTDSWLQPFTTQFPRADIYELLTPDLLHQAIKGTFKDHLVTWVEDYLKLVYGPSRGSEILDEVD
jgi:hypothetical protein